MILCRQILFALLFFFLTTLPSQVSAAGIDTSFRFSTIETEHFSIHYHQGLEQTAKKTARIAEAYHSYLTEIFQWTPREKTQVVLVDNSDFANGSATSLPYNLIRLRTIPPSIDSTIGEYDDWLKELFVHEYTHILTLDPAKGYTKVFRTIFGKPIPIFSNLFSLAGALFITPPNFYLPSWWKEGIATWAETEFTGAGRGRSSWIEMIYRTAVLEEKLPGIDEINGDTPVWPAGKMRYIFGLSMFKYMADSYGQSLPGTLALHHAKNPPYLSGRLPYAPFEERTNYVSLYRDMTDELKKVQKQQIKRIREKPLTDIEFIDAVGEFFLFPTYSPDGRFVAVTRRDPRKHPAVIILKRDGTPTGLSFERHTSSGSLSWSPDSQRILFSEASVINGFNIYEDIFSYDLKKDKVSRLTHGLRLRDPDIRPGDAQATHPVFAAVKSMRGGENLVIANFDPLTSLYSLKQITRLTSARVANPSWSPGGRYIVYESRENEGDSELHLYDTEQDIDKTLYGGRFSLAHPTWSPDGKFIIFVSDETGVFNLFAFRVEEKKLSQITNVTGGVFQPKVSPQGDEILFSSYHAAGMKIGKIPFTPGNWWDEPGPVIKKSWVEKKGTNFRVTQIAEKINSPEEKLKDSERPITPYSPLKTIVPRFWIPSVIADHEGVGPGFFTAGSDAVGYHAYFLKAEYVPQSRKMYYDAAYSFDALYPSFVLRTSSLPVVYSTSTGKDYYEVNKTSILQAFVPINRIDSGYSFTFGYHFEEQSALSPLINGRFRGLNVFQGTRDNIFVGLGFSNLERYPYSISSEKGRKLSFVVRYFSEKLRNGVNGTEYLFAYSESLPAPKPVSGGVFHIKVRGAAAQGSQTFQNSFQLGGHGGESFFFLRGYPSRSFRGQYVTAASLEYRLPLKYFFRGKGTIPVFLERLHGSLFVDSGEAWERNGRFLLSGLKTGAGAEFKVDMLLGYMQKLTPTIGFAHGFNSGGDNLLYFFINYGFDLPGGSAAF